MEYWNDGILRGVMDGGLLEARPRSNIPILQPFFEDSIIPFFRYI